MRVEVESVEEKDEEKTEVSPPVEGEDEKKTEESPPVEIKDENKTEESPPVEVKDEPESVAMRAAQSIIKSELESDPRLEPIYTLVESGFSIEAAEAEAKAKSLDVSPAFWTALLAVRGGGVQHQQHVAPSQSSAVTTPAPVETQAKSNPLDMKSAMYIVEKQSSLDSHLGHIWEQAQIGALTLETAKKEAQGHDVEPQFWNALAYLLGAKFTGRTASVGAMGRDVHAGTSEVDRFARNESTTTTSTAASKFPKPKWQRPNEIGIHPSKSAMHKLIVEDRALSSSQKKYWFADGKTDKLKWNALHWAAYGNALKFASTVALPDPEHPSAEAVRLASEYSGRMSNGPKWIRTKFKQFNEEPRLARYVLPWQLAFGMNHGELGERLLKIVTPTHGELAAAVFLCADSNAYGGLYALLNAVGENALREALETCERTTAMALNASMRTTTNPSDSSKNVPNGDVFRMLISLGAQLDFELTSAYHPSKHDPDSLVFFTVPGLTGRAHAARRMTSKSNTVDWEGIICEVRGGKRTVNRNAETTTKNKKGGGGGAARTLARIGGAFVPGLGEAFDAVSMVADAAGASQQAVSALETTATYAGVASDVAGSGSRKKDGGRR